MRLYKNPKTQVLKNRNYAVALANAVEIEQVCAEYGYRLRIDESARRFDFVDAHTHISWYPTSCKTVLGSAPGPELETVAEIKDLLTHGLNYQRVRGSFVAKVTNVRDRFGGL